MRDLQLQIRDYFDEAAEPVTIEDVFFAKAGDEKVRPVEPFGQPIVALRRRWLIAAAAAVIVAVVIGAIPALLGGATTPSTVPPVTEAPTTTVTPTTTVAPPTSAAPEPIGFDPGPLPQFGAPVPLDPALEEVAAQLLALATQLDVEPPFEVKARFDTDDSGARRIEASIEINPQNDDDLPLQVLPIFVYPTVEDAEAAFLAAVAEEQSSRQIDASPLGDESFAVMSELGRRLATPRLVVRSGTAIVDMRIPPDEEILTASPFIESLFAIRDGRTELDVVLAPLTFSGELPATYESATTLRASIANRPGREDDPTFIERGYALGVTPGFTRCRFYEAPFGSQEPEDLNEWIDDGSGTVTLDRQFREFDESINDDVGRTEQLEVPDDDPRYVAHRAGCDRFTPIATDWGFDELWARSASGVDATDFEAAAYRVDESEWVLGVIDERSEALDLDLLFDSGVLTTPDPDGVDIFEPAVTFDAGGRVVAFYVDATGSRSAIETAFGIDLSSIPEVLIEFSLEYGFRHELNGPGQW